MISENQSKSRTIAESKIIHKSPILHPLARFVTEETVALLFNISVDEIYRIECCRYMVYVHAKGISRFVSYADFPPILEVNPPSPQDFGRWYKRWKGKQAPGFWTKFYTHKFKEAVSVDSLLEWGMLVAKLKSAISASGLQQLRDVYAQEKDLMERF
ncbi:MAG: hypothetical protein JGK17_00990 [Microcoleus sp. PH2017_10_PVI_O_A]|uniref:hypothetical protein n=1 Tax=unclassified Microcoleus TaxID=2642155 RepID=UPI001D9D767E|nr:MULTISPECIES: hypothetical protein [unclassified Microcoleus]TAE84817.1 MAG: hypothetical protein EAZ83_04345 [Oscillatoriales cyanobacterium]MCC3404195.1 hypothetical protein [Microcoleus sp. PH2017_10_PVI_O_A]MCC3458281.1 hypothetical protein [Microcoleus sp. PH2017_11_PCY_U_A]MCC3476633.1 hypothetical protein [Microcoleus sp. PH2017_12_PCY_D_A]MCC3532153.1 hypothetical protein [Microcoleus sp. PH2017_21_RUC_O_A]